jgi:peptide deformylase
MKELSLKTYPDKCLTIKTKPVKIFGKELASDAKKMADIMYVSQGIGLATTQVGLDYSMLVVDIGGGLHIFVNPEILECSPKKTKLEEGCLSLPGIKVAVSRPSSVKVKAQDHKGASFICVYDGLMAKVLQHEIDHLSGKVIIDYINPILKFACEKKLLKKTKCPGKGHSGKDRSC